MHGATPVVVKKGSFLSAVAYGFFGLLTATVVCGMGVGLYAVNVLDRKSDRLLGIGDSLLRSLPDLQASLPPALADMLDDRRDPSYREQVDLEVRLVADAERSHGGRLVLEVTNNGSETITVLAVRVVLVDDRDVPVQSISTYAATPLTVDDDWRGPLMPESTRRCAFSLYRCDSNLTPKAEITDIRVWTGAVAAEAPDSYPVEP